MPRDRVFDRAMERRIGVDHPAQHVDRHAGMDRDRERAEDLAACGPGGCRPGQHAGLSVGDQLDEPVVTRAVDPAPGGRRIGDTAVRTMRPLARACASVRPTAPIWGSVKVTRGSAR
jgi:hypothetical protein